MNRSRTFFAFVLAFVVVGLLYLLSPWVAAFVLQQRVSRYVKIRVDYPGCVPGTHAFDLSKCQCEFVFEHVKRPGELVFENSQLRQSYDPVSRTLTIFGTGTIRGGSNRLIVSADRISINGTDLPPDHSPYHAFIHSDGTLTNSRMDIAY